MVTVVVVVAVVAVVVMMRQGFGKAAVSSLNCTFVLEISVISTALLFSMSLECFDVMPTHSRSCSTYGSVFSEHVTIA